MPSIYLGKTKSYYPGGGSEIQITEEEYEACKLFKSYKHTYPSLENENVWIYKGDHGYGKCLTLTRGSTYASAKLKEVYVYVNQYDDKKTPLVLVLMFQNGGNGDKYYKVSEFESATKQNGGTKEISQLCNYENDGSILKDLLTENDKLSEPLTYQIEKTQGDPPSDNGNGSDTYNGGKMKVNQESVGEPNLSGTGFSRYKHTPANGNGSKNACVIYDGNVLLQKDGRTEVPKIQNQEYKCIRVYFGDRAKKKCAIPNGDQPIEVPLLIELNKQDGHDQQEYYVHKKNNTNGASKYYWEQLPGSGGNTLKDLLVDMGFGMKTGEPGHEKLKKILESSGVNGVGEGDDLSSKLSKISGTKLQAMLQEKVGAESGSSQKSFLQLLLTRIEFDLLDSVVILLEKRPPSSSTYDEGQVSTVVKSLDPSREINRVKMNNGTGKKITVSDKTDNNGKGSCVTKYKYKVYEHDFSKVVNGLGQNGKSAVGIRFIMPSQQENQYKQLALYSAIDKQAEPNKIVYNYYQKNGESTSNSDKVYVWFYNGGDETGNGDPRPLMLCVNNTTYAPKNKDTYFTEWVKVNLSNGAAVTLNDCGCSTTQEQVQEGQNKLLKELDKVVKFLNTVNLKAGTSETGSGRGPHKYEVQTYKGKPIQIQVECSPVGSGSTSGTCSTASPSCYKKFKHTPAGLKNGEGGGGANNGKGYRLGEVQYIKNGVDGGSGEIKGTLDYKTQESKYKYHPLVGVTVYYYDKDTDYNDPLLIELEFKSNGGAGTGPKEYYKLKPDKGSNGTNLQWTIDGTASGKMNSDHTAVTHLDGIRHSLKKVMKIYIDQQMTYNLCLSTNPGGAPGGYSNGNGKKIEVREYTDGDCSKLKTEGYKCYVHKVSEINRGSFDYNQ